jgi:hypothetical protein
LHYFGNGNRVADIADLDIQLQRATNKLAGRSTIFGLRIRADAREPFKKALEPDNVTINRLDGDASG